MKKVITPKYKRCIITYYKYFTKEYYEVRHKETNKIIHALSLAEAYKVATLLDMECKAYNEAIALLEDE